MANDSQKEIKAVREEIESLGESLQKSVDLIDNSIKNSMQNISSFGDQAKKAGDGFYAGMLESERFYLEESKRLEEEQAKMTEEAKRLEYSKRLASAKNATNREIVEKNELLRRKKLADKEYLEQLKQTAEQEKKILNQLKQDIKKTYDEIAQYASERIGDVLKSQNKMEDKLANLGNITRKQIFKGLGDEKGEQVYTILSDIDPQIEAMSKYSEALKSLKERVSDSKFSDETLTSLLYAINEMSITDGTTFAELLGGLNDEKFTDYLSKWAEKQKLSESISKEIYSEQFTNAVDDVKEYMVKKLTEAGFSIPENFTLSGTESAMNFGSAFLEELEFQMEKIKKMVQSFSVSFEPKGIAASVAQSTGNYNSNSTTYILNGSGETVAQQLASARSHNELERMRNL